MATKTTKKKTTAKKKTTKKRAPRKRKPKKFEPMVDPDGNKYFTKEDLLDYNLAEQKFLNIQLVAAAKRTERRDAMVRFDREVAELKAVERRLRDTLMAKRRELNEKYSVNMFSTDFTYDDETGRIIGEGAPPPEPEEKET